MRWARLGRLPAVAVVAAGWPALPGEDDAAAYATRLERLSLGLDGSGAAERTSPPTPLSFAATSVGVHWKQTPDAPLGVAVRESADGREWSAWYVVEAEGGAPVDGAERLFGGLVAVSPARFAQVRLTAGSGSESIEAAGVELIALRSEPRPAARLLAILLPGDTAAAAIKPLGIVRRAQ